VSETGKPKTARSYRGAVVDDNAIISINIKWLIQMCILVAGLVYSYYQIVFRIGELERRVSVADTTITELVEKHIEEENKRYEQMEEELKWHQKLLKKKKK
jgi:uncharacterized coiled-coil protein SlyX|tara:strand:+ start:131 stop:433 length:303 start_codon:yes stop_codon:yes gene_type:complete